MMGLASSKSSLGCSSRSMMSCQCDKQMTGLGCKLLLPLAWLQQRHSAIKTRSQIDQEEVAMVLCRINIVAHANDMMHQLVFTYSISVGSEVTTTCVAVVDSIQTLLWVFLVFLG